MARKSAAAVATAPEFSFDPETLVPPSQVPAAHKDQYWTALLDSGIDALRAACATEEFFPLLREIPKAFWEKRFFVYLYRQWPKVKNAEKDKYIDKYPFPVDEAYVKEEHGGGGYLAYLNIDGKEQLKQITFAIDGPPKFKAGQILVDAQGNALPPATAPGAPQPSETAQIISAQSEAARANNELIKEGMKSVIEMQTDLTRQKLGLDQPAQKDPLETAIRLLEILKPQAVPVNNTMADALTLIDKLDAINARRNPPAPEKQETKLEEVGAIVETLTGKSLSDLTRGKTAAADPIASWVPIAQTAGQVALSFFEKLPHLMHERTEQLRLELQIRQAGGVPAPPANGTQPARLPAPTVIPPTQPVQAQPTAADPHALIQAVVKFICDGFDRDRNEGSEVAAALDVQFGEQMDALGITHMLGQRTEVQTFIDGIPELKQRSQDARWPEFFQDFMQFTEHTYGEEEPEPAGPQAVETPKPATA